MPNLSKWAKEWTKDKHEFVLDLASMTYRVFSDEEVKPEPGMNNSRYTQNDVY
nr:9754_t:CDS:2 [Entrophospora candida]